MVKCSSDFSRSYLLFAADASRPAVFLLITDLTGLRGSVKDVKWFRPVRQFDEHKYEYK